MKSETPGKPTGASASPSSAWKQRTAPLLSVVVPLRNEARNVGPLLDRLVPALDYGRRERRDRRGWLHRQMTRAFYRLFRWIGNIELDAAAGDFCLLDRRVVNALTDMPERSRFTRGLISWAGFRSAAVPVRRRVFTEVKSRSLYLVQESVGFEPAEVATTGRRYDLPQQHVA